MRQSGLQRKLIYLWLAADVVLSDSNKNWSSENVTIDIDGEQYDFKKRCTCCIFLSSSEDAEENCLRKFICKCLRMMVSEIHRTLTT